jgi:hypothetical protein
MRLLEPHTASLATVWTSPLQHYTKYSIAQLQPTVTALAEALFIAPSAKLATVYNKYTNKKFMKISRWAKSPCAILVLEFFRLKLDQFFFCFPISFTLSFLLSCLVFRIPVLDDPVLRRLAKGEQ